MNYSNDEFMICSLARQLKDGEVIAVGNNSPLPAAASLLARAMHAAKSTVYIIGQADWPFEGTKEFFDFMQRGRVDVFFLSGAQIDAYGNINLHVIGDYAAPKVRLPGGAGSAVVYFCCKRILLFKTDHHVKGFPEKLDFVSSVSSSKPHIYRNSQLEALITPLGILKPSGDGGRLQLHETAPGIKAEEVQSQTGFDLKLFADVTIADAPSTKELTILRTLVSQQLQSTYPEFAKTLV
jgi:glutaconate CoA-transferase subunit B